LKSHVISRCHDRIIHEIPYSQVQLSFSFIEQSILAIEMPSIYQEFAINIRPLHGASTCLKSSRSLFLLGSWAYTSQYPRSHQSLQYNTRRLFRSCCPCLCPARSGHWLQRFDHLLSCQEADPPSCPDKHIGWRCRLQQVLTDLMTHRKFSIAVSQLVRKVAIPPSPLCLMRKAWSCQSTLGENWPRKVGISALMPLFQLFTKFVDIFL